MQPLPQRIWEPCAGRGAIARELTAAGHDVVAFDLVPHAGADPGIVTPIDFLLERAAPAGCACIVTNPPYKLADAFIRHGLALVPTVIVLLRLMAIEGAGRSDLIDRHLVRVWAGIERLPTMHREGWSGNRLTNSGAPFAWFVFSADPRPAGTPIELMRMSWREP
ncbi:class I SAM-dependent methyltransferase [Chelatococcus sp. XZ-Ab1]|uniref:class I SAM-dependent methyltransferase n=1 Tax=Chelatococcus sp. XZ-Ab1 TaxID=3034027 RepID=UPI0023E36AB4|nr:class I SAM-dependent methyltransferase [Chelatococcus sp. XZ-Ab1]